MKEFPDDELDKLFRKSSEELDSTFDPDDWNALKRKLDEQDGKTPGALFKKWWPIGLLALLFIAGLTTYLLTKDEETGKVNMSLIPVEKKMSEKTRQIYNEQIVQDSNETVLNESGSETKLDVENEEIDNKNQILKNNREQQNEEFLTNKSSDKKLIRKAESKKILPRRWSKTGGVYLEPDRSIGRRVDGAFYSKNKSSETSRSQKESSSSEENVIVGNSKLNTETNSDNLKTSKDEENKLPVSPVANGENTSEISTEFNSEAVQSRSQINANLLKSRALVTKKSNKLPEIEKVETPKITEPTKAVEEERELTPKFAVRFGFSPDLSSVGLKNFTKPGTAVSLLIEYSFLPKLYFQTGLMRSSKGYNAKPGEYEWPSYWNDQKARPTSVDAICKVIEVPLNLRYDISQSDRSRWFVGAGTSSYYMQDEKYEYNYAPHTYNAKYYEQNAATGWYWLSHLNASAGYEYRFSNKLSLLAEPYVRVPIKKVGYGKVNLFTTGIWFSIRYTPNFK
ncbi:PorT family protein [Dyadobacter sp. CY345]|uniref:PorT family protein n=1 Tax=Dyadobacter sp. CY345 TaxID=2909335 RepID=UPI001F2A6133|nr:PorT family protein [Dyadobacter sp. CY345]MCF2446057.1 PorT family protein [Dyadobacter sp. CY345]